MAEATVRPGGKSSHVEWTLTKADREGQPVEISEYPHKTVSVSGGSVRLLGGNRPGEAFDVVDTNGFPVKGPGLYHVSLNPRWIWPVLDTEAASVSILAVKMGGM